MSQAAGAALSARGRSLPTVLRCTDATLPRPTVQATRSGPLYDVPWPHAPKPPASTLFKVLYIHPPYFPTTEEVARDLLPANVDFDGIKRQASKDPMRVTWIGHATLLVQVNGVNILTDPVFSDRCSASQYVGPKRFMPPALTPSDLPEIDVVVISHNHYDHLDVASVLALGDGPLWIVPLGIGKWLEACKITHYVELSWWDEVEIEGQKVKIVSVPAQHWSSRTPFDRNRTLWSGYAMVSSPEGGGSERFYFAGDTGYYPGIFDLIGSRLGPFDLAAIPIGAFMPRWFMSAQHVDPQDAVKLHKEVQSRRSLAIHWGTFPLSAETHVQAPQELVAARRAKNLAEDSFEILRHGESVVRGLPRRYPCLFSDKTDKNASDGGKADLANSSAGAAAAPGVGASAAAVQVTN